MPKVNPPIMRLAMIPIENSTAGPVYENYDLLSLMDLALVGEEGGLGTRKEAEDVNVEEVAELGRVGQAHGEGVVLLAAPTDRASLAWLNLW